MSEMSLAEAVAWVRENTNGNFLTRVQSEEWRDKLLNCLRLLPVETRLNLVERLLIATLVQLAESVG